MNVLVVDGQGGGLGRSIIEQLRREALPVRITGTGTNATATMAMLKAGADAGATGEAAIRYNAASADLILGAVGIAFVGSMHGEISPALALAVSRSPAEKILIPINRCHVQIAGVGEATLTACLQDMTARIREMLRGV